MKILMSITDVNWAHRIWRISETAAVYGSQILAQYRKNPPKYWDIIFFQYRTPLLTTIINKCDCYQEWAFPRFSFLFQYVSPEPAALPFTGADVSQRTRRAERGSPDVPLQPGPAGTSSTHTVSLSAKCISSLCTDVMYSPVRLWLTGVRTSTRTTARPSRWCTRPWSCDSIWCATVISFSHTSSAFRLTKQVQSVCYSASHQSHFLVLCVRGSTLSKRQMKVIKM